MGLAQKITHNIWGQVFQIFKILVRKQYIHLSPPPIGIPPPPY
ncbi:hypothetical protein VPHD520_0097 [Vibrio phage D520]